MFSTAFQIAQNTYRETLRQPIFFLVLLSALVLIGIFPTLTLFVFRDQVKLVVDSALATTMLFGWIAAGLSASHTISREISNGTALLVLSKPVQRPVFIASKILGILAALTVFTFLAGLATMLAVRVAKDQFQFDNTVLAIYFGALALSCLAGGIKNYLQHSSFPMDAVLAMLVILPLATLCVYFIPPEDEVQRLNWALVPALILVWYAVAAMGTLATALSTRFDLVPNLLICGVVFMVGLVSDYVLGRHAAENVLYQILYCLIPNWQLFWMADALAAQKQIPWSYVLWGAAYIGLFVIQFLLLAICLFWKREIGKQDVMA